ncbi:MAG: carboxypeptidase-like regulatory domain-containing protein, partial [Dyadobacter fermentans]
MIFSTRFSPLLLAVLLLLFGASAVRAQVPVSGRVTDASGPLVGVSVIIKGANGGTTTNTDGNFTINVPS